MIGHVLGLLEDGEERLWTCLGRSVELAEREHARLTLAKTTDPGRLVRWLGPFAIGTLYLPGQGDALVEAGHALARAAEFVPQDVPLTTLLLTDETQRELLRLIRSGRYDALVACAGLLSRCRRLSRELRKLNIETVPVTRGTSRTTIEIGA
jgi:hypothetical protein